MAGSVKKSRKRSCAFKRPSAEREGRVSLCLKWLQQRLIAQLTLKVGGRRRGLQLPLSGDD